MDDTQLVDDVIHKQATVKDVLDDYIAGKNTYQIGEEYGLDPEKVKEIILAADAQGKFIPADATPDVEAPVEATPEPAPEAAPVGPDEHVDIDTGAVVPNEPEAPAVEAPAEEGVVTTTENTAV